MITRVLHQDSNHDLTKDLIQEKNSLMDFQHHQPTTVNRHGNRWWQQWRQPPLRWWWWMFFEQTEGGREGEQRRFTFTQPGLILETSLPSPPIVFYFISRTKTLARSLLLRLLSTRSLTPLIRNSWRRNMNIKWRLVGFEGYEWEPARKEAAAGFF